MTSAFIEDGYTEERYIKAEDKQYPEVRFKFRPLLVDDREKLLEKIRSESSSVKAEQLVRHKLAEQIEDWSFDKPPTVDTLKIVKPRLLLRLANIVIYATDVGDDDDAKPQDLEADVKN